MKDERFVMNDFVQDDRGLVGWKITVPGTDTDQVLYSEEIVAQMLQYIKQLAETMAQEPVDECVITIPNWFSYDQRLMIKDAAESYTGMTVLQLIHENTAAATLFGIDKVNKTAQNHTVLFYNMGGMDTEVSIARYSHLNFTEG